MCRNIKTLFNFEPPATEDEIHAAALQFVRKLSGFNKPSQANAGGVRPRGGRGLRSRPESADLAAHPCAGARPRGRGGEGEGALAAAIWLEGCGFAFFVIWLTEWGATLCDDVCRGF